MDVQIDPGVINGTVRAVASKSDAHRTFILAALADGPTEIILADVSQDIQATTDCLRALGATIHESKQGVFLVEPIREAAKSARLDCRESGSTIRFLLPVAMALCEEAAFTGCGRLPERPLSPLKEELEQKGCVFEGARLPLQVTGRLKGGCYTLPGNVSSQFVSGLLLALALLETGGEIVLTSRLESRGYVDMTIAAMRKFEVTVEESDAGYRVPGGQRYRSPGRVQVEGDWSNAAFFLAAGAMNGDVTMTGLTLDSVQGDRKLLSILREMGADVAVNEDGSVRVRACALRGVAIDARDVPDLVPILAVLGARAEGVTRIVHAERLRIKESDRLYTTAHNLKAMGVDIREEPDGLVIYSTGRLRGATLESFHDHRIAMAMSIAATVATGPTIMLQAQAIEKSYPRFYHDLIALGGNVHVL